MTTKWQPISSLKIIQQRTELLNNIRSFFKKTNVLEVETPLLCQYPITAPHIDPIAVACNNGINRFLQTSPEYAMKRLLAAGSGDIFQIFKSFRGMEYGSLHNPEFTMLEWYRVEIDHHKLMAEIVDLLKICGINYKFCKISYRELFNKYLNLDPIIASSTELKQFICKNITLSRSFKDSLEHATKRDCQELLFNHYVEPQLTSQLVWFIHNYPIEQAELAKIVTDQDGNQVAERFEVYINGLELANGYHELLDPNAQQQRFLEDQKIREKLGKPYLEVDPYLIAALKQGLPSCSGVALGVDRLLMVISGAKSIREVISFPWDVA